MITQVVHIPTLNYMSDFFQVVHVSDVSNEAMQHCARKVAGPAPQTTRSAEELCASPDVDLVLIANSDTFHTEHARLALAHGKHVFVEKPIALTLRDCDRIIEADEKAGGKKVFVGYMRRYAAAFTDALKEVGGMEKVRYARVRDIIGPNAVFISQSGTFPRTFGDYEKEDSALLKDQTARDVRIALEDELGIPVTPVTALMWELLSGLGSHDVSAMRELLGMPEKVVGAVPCSTTASPFWSALFQYPNFAVSYESGIDQVPRFDASIEIFTDHKTVKVNIDTPFVKGLATTMQVQSALPDGSYQNSTIRKTYEDPYTLQFREVHEFVVNGKAPKTSPVDARRDVQINGMILRAMG
ncbi:myo-inositol 2-dehydrogenase [Stagonosporopsis vannaccii]|nr:myo-inositol 2-dehydrogenase [Stagonosporopsis vannaccii]